MGSGIAFFIVAAAVVTVGAMVLVLRQEEGAFDDGPGSHFEIVLTGSVEENGGRTGYLHITRDDASREVPFLVAAFDEAKAVGSAFLDSTAEDQAASEYLSGQAQRGVDWRHVEFDGFYFSLEKTVS